MPLTLAPWEALQHQDGSTEFVPAEMDGRRYSALDLRAQEQSDGWCFCAFTGTVPSSHIFVCADGSNPSVQNLNAAWQSYWMQATGRAFTGDNVADALVNIFSLQADHTGAIHNRPALPKRGERVLRLTVGEFEISTQFVPRQSDDPRVIPALLMHRHDYARMRQTDVAEARRELTRFMERYNLTGEEWRLVQTAAFASDGVPLPHSTTVTDDFSGTLSAWTQLTGTWTIDAGKLKADANAHRHIRYDTDLGSDHYSQAVISDSLSFPGVAIRDQTADTSTVNRYVLHTVSGSTTRLRRFNSATGFSGLATYGGIALGSTIKLDGNGSTIEAFDDGVSLGTVTDSTYSGVRPGLYMYGTTARLDDFEASDGAAAGISIPVVQHHRMRNFA